METCEFKTIKLEKPDLKGGMPLYEALSKRKSSREFDSSKFLTLKQVSQLLWCCYGNNREGNFKVVPSALHMNPLTIYAFMKSGTFKYIPEKSELEPVKEGDNRELAGIQPFVKNAALNIVIVADFSIKVPFAGYNLDLNARKRCAYLDSAHCCQNVYLCCMSEGLKCVERGGCQQEKLKELLKLDDNKEITITLSVGY